MCGTLSLFNLGAWHYLTCLVTITESKGELKLELTLLAAANGMQEAASFGQSFLQIVAFLLTE